MGMNDGIKTDPGLQGQVFLDDAFNGIANRDRNLWRADNYVKAVVDDAVTGPLNLAAMAVNGATLGLTDFKGPDSIMPDSFTTYHRNESFYRGTTGLVGAFFAGGAAMKAIREGGRIATALEGSKLPSAMVGAITSRTSAVEEAERQIGAARVAMAKTFGAKTGLNDPVFDMADAVPQGSTLSQFGNTYKQAQAGIMKERTLNGVKEGLAAEAAVFGLYNQNDFLFPEDQSVWSNLLMVGGGVGLSAMGERLAGAVARRKTMQAAALVGSQEAQKARLSGNMLTTADTTTGIGNEWQTVMAGLYGNNRVQEVEDNAAAMAQGSPNLTVPMLQRGAAEIKSTNNNMINGALNRMRMTSSADPVFSGKTPGINVAAISRPGAKLDDRELAQMNQQLIDNNSIGVGLSFLEDTDVGLRYEATRLRLEDAELTARKIRDSNLDATKQTELDKAAADLGNSLADLNIYRPAVIERSGSVNYNPYRFEGQLGREVNEGLTLRTGATSETLQFSGVRAKPSEGVGGPENVNRPVQLNRYGQVTTGADGFGSGKVLADNEMTPDELTQLQSLVGRATDPSAQTGKYWSNFWTSFSASDGDLSKLPFPVLDAMSEGRLKMPDSIPMTPAVAGLQQGLADGSVAAVSLAKKMEYMRTHPFPVGTSRDFDAHDFEKMLNLRLTNDAGQPNSVMDMLKAWRDTAGPNTSALSFVGSNGKGINSAMDAFVELANSRTVQGGKALSVDEVLQDLNSQRASNLTAHHERNGFGALYTHIAEPTDTEMALAKVVQARNTLQQNTLKNAQVPMIQAVVQSLAADPMALAQLSDVASLATLDAKNNLVTTTDFALRGERAIRGAANVGRRIKQAFDGYINDRVGSIAGQFKALFSENDIVSRAEIMEWQNLARAGIKLRESAIKAGLNEIDTSSSGAQRMLERLGELEGAPKAGKPWHAFSMAQAVNNRKYVPIEFGERSVGVLNDVFSYQYEALDAMNALNQHAGKRLMDRFNGHMPVDDQRRFFRSYAVDVNGHMFYVKGRTQREADAALADMMNSENARMKAGGKENFYRQVTETQIAQYYAPLDQTFLHSISDWSGIKQTGTSGGRYMDPRIDLSTDNFDSMLLSMRQLGDDIRERTTVAALAPVMNEANRINGMVKANGMTMQGGKLVKSAFTGIDNWQNILLSRDQLPEASIARKVHATVEQLYNDMSAGVDRLAQTIPLDAAGALMHRVFGEAAAKARGVLHMPSKGAFDTADYLLANYKPLAGILASDDLRTVLKLNSSPDSFKLSKQLQQFNKYTTRAFLAFANLAHPLLNFMGIAATLPAVVRQVQRMPGETNEQWMARGGGMFDYIDPEKGEATINPVKLTIEAMHILHNDPTAYQKAKQLGFMDANMLEGMYEQSKLKPNSFEDALDWGIKYLDFINLPFKAGYKKVTGKEFGHNDLSEWSEVYSRAISHMAGLALMRRSGRTDLSEEEMHTFAHWFANQNIADFSPNMRGQLFRGVAGIPVGLFQSYGINILQRMFGYVEDKNKRALITQLAMQGAMFGGQSMPGWPLLNSYYYNTKDMKATAHGATNLNERVYDGMGKFWGDVLLTGVPANLTQLLGGSSGINMYTSGDVNPRNPFSLPPAASLIQQMGQGLFETLKVTGDEIQNVKDGLGFEPGRYLEIVSNYAPSRGYRSLADLLLGEHTDRKGNVSQEDTRTGVALLSRMLGMRTSDETKRSAAIWENSQAQSQRIADMTRVRNSMLRRMDDGQELSDQDLQAFMSRYLAAGGTDNGWKSWLKTTMDKANYTRGDRVLDTIVSKNGTMNGRDLAAAQRLFYAGVTPGNTAKSQAALQAEAARMGNAMQ